MNAERWSQLKDAFDRTFDLSPDQQLEAVRQLCRDDSVLEAELLRLLQANGSAGDFLESSAGNLHEHIPAAALLPGLLPGAELMRRFEIRRFINSGGMGEVYEAWDLHLHQPVALKTILPHIAAHEEVIDRFKREVRHARAVSHPAICRVHELFCHEEPTGARTWFLSMELLDGPTLKERIREGGPLLSAEGVPVTLQLLQGMEAAHAQGLVHRDFKSSNVILLTSAEGVADRAVITDFGLSLRMLPGTLPDDERAGVGTPHYMSPEQKSSGRSGPLADQYALGVVLHEMITGALPEAGDTSSSVLRNAVAKGRYPARWTGVIRRCMAEKPEERFPDIAAVRAALMTTEWQRRGRWIALCALLAVLALAGVVLRRSFHPTPYQCLVCDVTQLTPDTDESESPALSRDGHTLAYSSDRGESGNLDVFVQQLPSGRLTRITNDHARDGDPTLSPDGSTVAFRSERAGGGIYIAQTANPAGQRLLVREGRNPQFSPNGRELLYWTGDANSNVHSGRIFRMDLASGKSGELAPGFADARYPQWNASGDGILFTGCSTADQLPPGCFDWWVAKASLQPPVNTHGLAVLRGSGLTPGRLNAAAWWQGRVIFSAIGAKNRLNLASVAIDPATLQAHGAPEWLLPEQTGNVDPAVAGDNSIAFTKTEGALHIWRLTHALSGRKAALEKVTDDTDVDGSPFVSEGGTFLLFARGRTTRRRIILHNTATGQEEVVVDAGTPVQTPIVDRSGTWIAYQQTEPDGGSAIYAGRRGEAMRLMCRNCTEPSGWFEGDRAFFYRDGAHGSINLMDPRSREQVPVLQTSQATLSDASWSPVSRSLLFVASSGSAKKMYAVPMREMATRPQALWRPIDDAGGQPLHPRWSGDGKMVVYLSNADGFQCLYGRPFLHEAPAGSRLPLAHFHHQRASIDNVLPRVFNLSADGDTLYFNLGEQSSSIQLGHLHR